ncbi:EAL domain-containing protein [Xanthomonas massiliensis]|jgi:sensor c-di-GMP phosphodiesterase-like protein|uniref:EAL domain-containing protein n=1 Tax=Xanthomonas massiliensis TaxID=1720302 RepID=UPI000824E13B|nr:EAL domain-containing protein [Xanthomonas massiliensis]
MYNDQARRCRARFVLPALVLAGILAALAWAQWMLDHRQQARLQDYAQRLLARADAVSGEEQRTLRQLQRPGQPACSPADLDELRFRLYQARYLRDVGRLRDGALACTAMWGRLAQPWPLPPPDHAAAGRRIWKSVVNIGDDPRIVTDLTASGAALVSTAPLVFEDFAHPGAGLAATLLTRDGRHVYHRFADTAARTHWHDLPGAEHLHLCSDRHDLCVAASIRRPLALAFAPLLAITLALIGALAGAGVGLGLAAWHRRRHSLPRQLRRALADAGGALELRYQPLRRLGDRRLVGVEALSRWHDEDGHAVAPEVFVPLAERMGLAGRLSRRIVQRALAELGPRLRDDSGFYVSVNLTAADVLDEGFHRFLDEQAARHGVLPPRLVLEITERSTAGHGALAAAIRRLRARGYRFYIDDFGTGYSSLAYLADLPVDAIKIDRMFTGALGTGAPMEQIFAPLCELARRLDVALVVEGIEHEPQAAHVLRLAPEALGQGWLLGRPVPARDLPPA